jgi:SAM-dependent methyltransferase
MNESPVFQTLDSLADPARARLLQLLERHELSVSELCAVVQLPQSTVSRHLRVLSDEGWLSWRSEGPSRYYRLARELEPDAGRLWEVVREAVAGGAESLQDRERAREVLLRRRTRSQEFFSSAAGQWDSVRRELFGESPELPALLALLDPDWVVGDLGCGTGRVAEVVAPYVRRVIGIDESPDMLVAARARLGELAAPERPGADAGGESAARVELRQGRVEALPLDDGTLDVALLVLVLHYVANPERAMAEAWRALRPGGRLLVVDMITHGRVDYRERMGHLWPGFERPQVEEWFEEAGFGGVAYHAVPADPEAKGPLLFAATGRKLTES